MTSLSSKQPQLNRVSKIPHNFVLPFLSFPETLLQKKIQKAQMSLQRTKGTQLQLMFQECGKTCIPPSSGIEQEGAKPKQMESHFL